MLHNPCRAQHWPHVIGRYRLAILKHRKDVPALVDDQMPVITVDSYRLHTVSRSLEPHTGDGPVNADVSPIVDERFVRVEHGEARH
jgi:hypothetical protein